jgi:hypothetical protein
MMVYTLKRAAGEVSFGPNETLDLPSELVDSLVQAGAVRLLASVEPETPAEPPKKGKKAKNDGPNSDS